MKLLKKADQKNFRVDTGMYAPIELDIILKENPIEELTYDYRVYAQDIKEIKIVMFEGFYYNVAIMNNGVEIFIIL